MVAAGPTSLEIREPILGFGNKNLVTPVDLDGCEEACVNFPSPFVLWG